MDTNAPSWSSSSSAPWSPAPRAPLATQPPPAPPEPDDVEPPRRSIVGVLVALAVLLALVAAGVVTWLVLRDDDKAPTVLTPETVAGLTLDPDATQEVRDYVYRGGRELRLPVVAVYGSGNDGYFVLAGRVPSGFTAASYTDLIRRRVAAGGGAGEGVETGPDQRVTAGGITASCVEVAQADAGGGPFCVWSDDGLLFATFSLTDRPLEDVVAFLAAARRAATP